MHNSMSLVTKGFLCPSIEQTVATVLPAPQESQNLLVRALHLPLPPSMTEAKGIHSSDIIIRTALTMAIADIRANPWLLDHVFASLIDDVPTANVYGEKERQQAKSWFLKTDIPVVMDYRMDGVEANSISISLVDSSETENTLGDVHYQPFEDVEAAWPPLTSAFTPEAYSAATGILRLPAQIADSLLVTTGMVVLDRVGRIHQISDVLDRSSVVLKPGTIADFTDSVIKGSKPRLVQEVESLAFRETYRIGVHAHGEPFHLTWLHSIAVFALLRYKQALLEARGFERSVISSSPFAKNEAMGHENFWTRFISITGYVRQYWPKTATQRILSSEVSPLNVDTIGNASKTYSPDAGFTEEDAPWMSQDGVGTTVK
jgi:hypothetical protein